MDKKPKAKAKDKVNTNTKDKIKIKPKRCEIIGEPITINYFSKAKDVMIAGLFNRWEPEKMTKGKDREWTIVKNLKNGIYKFNFIVNGVWCHDIRYEIDERDEFYFSDDSDNEGNDFVNKCNKIKVNAYRCDSCMKVPVTVLFEKDKKICANCTNVVYNDDDLDKNSDDECPDCGNYALKQVKLGKQKILACEFCDEI